MGKAAYFLLPPFPPFNTNPYSPNTLPLSPDHSTWHIGGHSTFQRLHRKTVHISDWRVPTRQPEDRSPCWAVSVSAQTDRSRTWLVLLRPRRHCYQRSRSEFGSVQLTDGTVQLPDSLLIQEQRTAGLSVIKDMHINFIVYGVGSIL